MEVTVVLMAKSSHLILLNLMYWQPLSCFLEWAVWFYLSDLHPNVKFYCSSGLSFFPSHIINLCFVIYFWVQIIRKRDPVEKHTIFLFMACTSQNITRNHLRYYSFKNKCTSVGKFYVWGSLQTNFGWRGRKKLVFFKKFLLVWFGSSKLLIVYI